MKRYLILTVLIAIVTETYAQFDTASIRTKALAAEDSLIALFKRRDWESYAGYMHPSVIHLTGGKEKFVTVLKEGMKALENASFDEVKIGQVLQVIKLDGQYQCVVESFMQMTFSGVVISGSSYDLAFSTDGDSWWFLRIDQDQTPEKIRQLLPELSRDLKFPKSQFVPGKKLDEFMNGYRIEYMN